MIAVLHNEYFYFQYSEGAFIPDVWFIWSRQMENILQSCILVLFHVRTDFLQINKEYEQEVIKLHPVSFDYTSGNQVPVTDSQSCSSSIVLVCIFMLVQYTTKTNR